MRDYEVKGNMTNTGPEKHQPNNEEELTSSAPATVHQDSQKTGLR